jgi:uncharacterized protein YcnI
MIRRIAVMGGVVMLGITLTALPAWAHVTVSPDSAPKGASDVEIGFRVPNEEASASTNQIQIALPSSPPILNALAESVPGWTDSIVTTHLAKPIQTDDGPLTDVVTQVSWKADSPANAIKPGNYEKFGILVGSLPSTGDQIVFRAIQTYSNGDVVRWIDPVVPGGPEAEHPTPILQLTSPTTPGGSITPISVAPGGEKGGASALPSDVATKSDTNTARNIGIVAIVFAVIALIAVAFSMMRKRPASS